MRTIRVAPFAFVALTFAVACGTLTGSSETSPPVTDSGTATDAPADATSALDAPLVSDVADADAGPTSPCAVARPASSGTISVSFGAVTRTVYCDMDTAGGGWTLVGRTSPDGGAGGFGWKSSSGNLATTSSAYSLGVDFEFHEILWGQVDPSGNYDTYQWGTNVFRGHLDSHALLATTDAATIGAVAVTDRRVVKGTCQDVDVQSGQSMFSYAGYADRTDEFFFRDNGDNGNYGLTHTHFSLSTFTDCKASAGLDNTVGMLFVR